MLQEIEKNLSSTNESLKNIQTALLSVDVMARAFARLYPSKFEAVFPHLIKIVDVDTANANTHVLGTAFICIGTVFETLQVQAVQMIPVVMTRLMDALDWLNASKTTPAIFQQCTLSALIIIAFKKKVTKIGINFILNTIFYRK